MSLTKNCYSTIQGGALIDLGGVKMISQNLTLGQLQQPQRRGPVPFPPLAPLPPCAFVAPGLISTFRGLHVA
jgi:hypothetical protein